MKFDPEQLKYNDQGLIPAIIQQVESKAVLMMAWMNQEAVAKTLATGETWFYSRSRQKLWHKGESSGHIQRVKSFYYDCDQDTLLLMVDQVGPGACHQGYASCFHQLIDQDGRVQEAEAQQFDPDGVYGRQAKAGATIIDQLYQVILARQEERPEGSYTTYLFDQGIDKICKKIGEEAAEVIIAAKNNDQQEVIYEGSDLIYHLLVLLAQQGVTCQQLYTELATRRK